VGVGGGGGRGLERTQGGRGKAEQEGEELLAVRNADGKNGKKRKSWHSRKRHCAKLLDSHKSWRDNQRTLRGTTQGKIGVGSYFEVCQGLGDEESNPLNGINSSDLGITQL